MMEGVMNEMTMRLIEEVDRAIQGFVQKNRLTLDCKNIMAIPARIYPDVVIPEILSHSGGIKCSLEFRAYLADEPYRSIAGYGSKEAKTASLDIEQ
jgi:hypothetical protein